MTTMELENRQQIDRVNGNQLQHRRSYQNYLVVSEQSQHNQSNKIKLLFINRCVLTKLFLIQHSICTWEQLPLLAVLKSAIKSANVGSSIHTFFVD